jgi:hypothetical protein
MVILGMSLEVIGKVIDARRQKRHLNFRGTGIALSTLITGDDAGLVVSGNCHCGVLEILLY